MSEEIIKELQAIHRFLDNRSKDEFDHRKATKEQFDTIMGKLDELEPILKVYKVGLSWSTGTVWLTKWFMKVIGGIGVIVGTIIAIKELFKR